MKFDHLKRRLAGGFFAAIPFLLLAFDLLRPLVFEQAGRREEAIAGGYRPPTASTGDFALIAVFLFGAAGMILLAISKWQKLFLRAATMLWAVFFAFVVAESALHMVRVPRVFEPGTKHVFDVDARMLPGVSGPVHYTINSIGLRGPDCNNSRDYKILCIGGSTTICTYQDDSRTWPALLMQKLNDSKPPQRTCVQNAARSAAEAIHHIVLMQQLPEARRVQCCIFLMGVNDLEHALRGDATVNQRRAGSRVFDAGGEFNPFMAYLRQTITFKTVERLLRSDNIKKEMRFSQPQGMVAQSRRDSRAAAKKDFPLPDLTDDLRAYRVRLSRLADICRERNIRCIFMTQPTSWRMDMTAAEEALLTSAPIRVTHRAVSAGDLARGMEMYNHVMREFCRDAGVECVDLAALIPKDMSMFYDDEHFTDVGTERVSRIVADAVAAKWNAATQPAETH